MNYANDVLSPRRNMRWAHCSARDHRVRSPLRCRRNHVLRSPGQGNGWTVKPAMDMASGLPSALAREKAIQRSQQRKAQHQSELSGLRRIAGDEDGSSRWKRHFSWPMTESAFELQMRTRSCTRSFGCDRKPVPPSDSSQSPDKEMTTSCRPGIRKAGASQNLGHSMLDHRSNDDFRETPFRRHREARRLDSCHARASIQVREGRYPSCREPAPAHPGPSSVSNS